MSNDLSSNLAAIEAAYDAVATAASLIHTSMAFIGDSTDENTLATRTLLREALKRLEDQLEPLTALAEKARGGVQP